jgi:hypothetical protein
MVNANPNDWASLTAMFKFGRGADPGRAGWAFVYGYQPDDAEAVMAEVLAAGLNPYELKSPEMTSTVDPDYRTRVFGFIRANEDLLFRGESAARVALLHSSASRDYVDGACLIDGDCGVGLYETWQVPTAGQAWWTDGPDDSVSKANYLPEYRGLAKALIRSHVPFDLLPSRLVAAGDLARYDLVMVPDPRALSADEATALRQYVTAGGHLLLTGPAPGSLDELGLAVAGGQVPDLMATAPASGCAMIEVGQGRSTWCPGTPGRDYFGSDEADALATISGVVASDATPMVLTDADPLVHFEAWRQGGRLALHAVNLTGGTGNFTITPTSFNADVLVGSAAVSGVTAIGPRLAAPVPVAFTQDGERVTFQATVDLYTVFVIQ